MLRFVLPSVKGRFSTNAAVLNHCCTTSLRGRFGSRTGLTPATASARSLVEPSRLLSRPLVIVRGEPLASRPMTENVQPSANVLIIAGPDATRGRQKAENLATCV